MGTAMADAHTQGAVSELITMTKLMEQGLRVSQPVGDHCAYDYIVDDGSKLYRVQCKTARAARATSITANLRRSRHPDKGGDQLYTENDIDVYVVYWHGSDTAYWIPFDDAPTTKLTLNLDPESVSSRTRHNLRPAEEYDIYNVFSDNHSIDVSTFQ